jgi:hypothetical protein
MVHRGWTESPMCSSWLPGVSNAEVDNAQEGCWSRCGEALALLGR